MSRIPLELLEQIERNNVALLVGEEINEGVLPTPAELARELATRCDYPKDEPKTLRRVAGYYLLATNDRHGLIDFLRQRLDRPGVEPSASHRLIAELEPRVVVTTCYDRLLEQAVQQAAVSYSPVVGNEEIAYGDQRHMLLVWLLGVIDRPDSLIVTEDERLHFTVGRQNLSHVLRGELSRRTWLFLGHDPQDEWFPSYYDCVTRDLDRHRRRSYLVGRISSAYARAWWAQRAQIIDLDTEPFLSQLNRRLNEQTQPQPENRPQRPTVKRDLPRRPYKLLDFYEGADAAIFFGRQAEIQSLSSLVHAHRLALLYGASGVGKTSLLLAGVVPRLKQAQTEYETVYLRALEDPVAAIRRAVRRRFPEATLPEQGTLVDFLDAATRLTEHTLVIILDQFEAFFIRFSRQFRQTVIAELGALYDAHDVPVKIVLSLREDWLASVNEIRERIPEVFYVDLRLRPLTRPQAREAITGPVEQLNVRYERALVERLLDDLTESKANNENEFVMPPQLQLVCHAVYEQARAHGRRLITLADYESVGGAQGILVRYLEEALYEHRGDEREMARKVLMALVTWHGTKTELALAALAAELDVETATLEPVLSRLVAQRLVRRLHEGHVYELAHDVLADTIASWISEEERQRKQARELLRREFADWQQDPTVFPGQSKFQRINALRHGLRLTEEESAFLLRTAVLYDADVPYWLQQVSAPESQCQILLQMLQSQVGQARLTAANYLADYPRERVATALAQTALEDPETAVRDTAAVSLGQMEDQSGVRFLLSALGSDESRLRRRALRALTLIRDVAPAQLDTIPKTRRLQIAPGLVRLRLRRDWPIIRRVTTNGALAGAVGFGIGLTGPFAYHVSQIALNLAIVYLTAPLVVMFGLLAGAAMAFGISAGAFIFRGRTGIGRVIGGTVCGGVGFASSLYAFAEATTFSGILLETLGSGLFGALIALGITLSPRREVRLIAGTVGGSLGILAWGDLGFEPFQPQSLPLPLLLAAGGLTGLIMAVGITWAEKH